MGMVLMKLALARGIARWRSDRWRWFHSGRFPRLPSSVTTFVFGLSSGRKPRLRAEGEGELPFPIRERLELDGSEDTEQDRGARQLLVEDVGELLRRLLEARALLQLFFQTGSKGAHRLDRVRRDSAHDVHDLRVGRRRKAAPPPASGSSRSRSAGASRSRREPRPDPRRSARRPGRGSRRSRASRPRARARENAPR